MDFMETYKEISSSLKASASSLEGFLQSYVPEGIFIDRISARVKSADRFSQKALKEKDGIKQYSDPINDIQDVIGARIVVLYLSEVEILKRKISSLLTLIERKGMEPEGFNEFGYVGWHAIAYIPEEALPDPIPEDFPKFFEIQIKTVFQHAWAEAAHDLEYKEFRGKLSREEKKLIAFAAAQAWGADNSFEAVLEALRNRGAEI